MLPLTTIEQTKSLRYLRAFPATFVAYGTVSVLSLIVELAVLHTLTAVEVRAPIAVSLAFITASLFQFSVLRYVVFNVTHKAIVFQANAYLIAAILSWWLVVGLVSLLTFLFKITPVEARAITVPLLFPVNYVVNRYFVFSA